MEVVYATSMVRLSIASSSYIFVHHGYKSVCLSRNMATLITTYCINMINSFAPPDT